MLDVLLVLKILITILLSTIIVLAFTTSSEVAGSTDNLYCFDEDMEGYICFDTRKACEKEQQNDLLAESKCYISAR